MIIINRSRVTSLRIAFRRTTLRAAGHNIAHHVMDNESSPIITDFLTAQGATYQFVPPNNHRANPSERAIRTFKAHFIAGLASAHPDFPAHLWCRLLPQAEVTLNLLRSSNLHPHLSAHATLHGAFRFTYTPLAPPGSKVMAHIKPNLRHSWGPRAEPGWYLGPAPDQYR